MENNHLSADTLFNFTPKIEYLISKIENRFKPRLVLEKYHNFGINLERAFPMVCFCDIRLSDISAHTKEYGDYGIGLGKEWGVRKELNPLIYISSQHSGILGSFSDIITNQDKAIRNSAAKLFLHFKPYSGEQNGKNRNFYNEREWRYIPEENSKIMSLSKEKFDEDIERESVNMKLANKKGLDFSFNDIKYIILKSQSEKQEISKVIARSFSVSEDDVYKNICFITKNMIEKDL